MLDDVVIQAADAEGSALSATLYEAAREVGSQHAMTAALRRGHGVALRRLRLSAGLSLEQVAERCRASGESSLSCHRSLVGQWEQGLSVPSMGHHRALATMYGVSYAVLAGLGYPPVGVDATAARDPWATGRE